MFSLNFMFFCSLIEELCTKEENYKASCNFNFGHECISIVCYFSLYNVTVDDKGNVSTSAAIWFLHFSFECKKSAECGNYNPILFSCSSVMSIFVVFWGKVELK